LFSLGIFFSELAQNFKLFKSSDESFKLRFYIGHDGSMIRLATGLGLGHHAPLRWPALGSEIVMEVRRSAPPARYPSSPTRNFARKVWRTREGKDYVRVLHEGAPVPSLAWVPLDRFIDSLEAQVPENVYEACMAS
jgi:hypothetical protein